jgi:hypothetical protein
MIFMECSLFGLEPFDGGRDGDATFLEFDFKCPSLIPIDVLVANDLLGNDDKKVFHDAVFVDFEIESESTVTGVAGLDFSFDAKGHATHAVSVVLKLVHAQGGGVGKGFFLSSQRENASSGEKENSGDDPDDQGGVDIGAGASSHIGKKVGANR